jgi:hypothetical protein
MVLPDAFCPTAIFWHLEVTTFGAAMAANDVAKVVAVPPPSSYFLMCKSIGQPFP